MSLLASVSRAGAVSQITTCGRALASLGLSVAKKCSPGNHQAPLVQHATSALHHNMQCSPDIDCSNLSLGQAIQDRIERKKYLMGLATDDFQPSQHAHDSGRANLDAPRHSSFWDTGLSHSSSSSSPVQRSTMCHVDRSSSMRATASSSAAPQPHARLLRFLDPALMMSEQGAEDDSCSAGNWTLMEALRHQRVKIIAQDLEGCQSVCNGCGIPKATP